VNLVFANWQIEIGQGVSHQGRSFKWGKQVREGGGVWINVDCRGQGIEGSGINRTTNYLGRTRKMFCVSKTPLLPLSTDVRIVLRVNVRNAKYFAFPTFTRDMIRGERVSSKRTNLFKGGAGPKNQFWSDAFDGWPPSGNWRSGNWQSWKVSVVYELGSHSLNKSQQFSKVHPPSSLRSINVSSGSKPRKSFFGWSQGI